MKMRLLVLWVGALGGALAIGGCASGGDALGDDPAFEGEGGEGGEGGGAGTTSIAGKGGSAGSSAGSGGSAGSGAGTGGSAGGGGSAGTGGSAGAQGGSAGAAGGSACGDGIKQEKEQCDKADLAGQTCGTALDPSYAGKLACKTNCQFDFSGCAKNPTCGDGAINTASEECDDNDFGGKTCAKVLNKPGSTGVLSCTAGCKIDSSGCKAGPYCGDGKKGADEACDGNDLGTANCASATGDPNKGGTLACAADCKFDTSKCVDSPKCGDGKKNNDTEQCDGSDLDGATCKSALGNQKAEGTVSCDSNCKFDTSQCTVPPYCGDGKKNNTEACDGQDFGGADCSSELGKPAAGQLVCSPDCSISSAKCEVVPYCGDGVKNGTEPCEGADLGGADCASAVGPGSTGTLACAADCKLDTSQCTVPPNCGNGKLDPDKGEQCDGALLNGKTCVTELKDSHAVGTVSCNSDCTLNTSQCTIPPYCGDGKLNQGSEECDDGNTTDGDGCNKSCKVVCFNGEKKFGTHCYLDSWSLASDEEQSWDGAEAYCVEGGGHLVSISSQEELQFVFDLMPGGVFDPTSPRWIGLNDKKIEGSFGWSSGEPVVATAWASGEPNDSGGNEDCTEMKWNNGQWNDRNCSTSQLFICEFPPPVKFP